MWIYMIAGFLVLVGLAGTLFGAGIFTIVLIPIGLVILASGVGYGMWARAQHGEAGAGTEAHPPVAEPLPQHLPDSEPAPTTPDELVDARRAQQ